MEALLRVRESLKSEVIEEIERDILSDHYIDIHALLDHVPTSVLVEYISGDRCLHVVRNNDCNIVTCGNCGEIIIHHTSDTEIACHQCKYTSEPCDFPDLFH